MGRALSWSLAGHAGFVIVFLLLSANRQPLTIPQIARPVRLVTYLEPAAAPRQRIPAPAAARIPQPAVASTPAPADAVPLAPPATTAASPVVIPVRVTEPAAAVTPAQSAEPRSALSERLARRLASTTPAETVPAEVAAPRIASLPPPEMVAAAPSTGRPVAATPPAPQGAVRPVGYFPHAWYLAVLKDTIYARWTPPSEFFKSSRPPAALVSFRIDRAGGIDSIALKESSGSARFDKSALAAVQGLLRVPVLPEQYVEETLDVVIRFQNLQ